MKKRRMLIVPDLELDRSLAKYDKTVVEVDYSMDVAGSIRWCTTFDGECVAVAEAWLHNVESVDKNSLCECGAEYTSFPQYHFDWCPEYKKRD